MGVGTEAKMILTQYLKLWGTFGITYQTVPARGWAFPASALLPLALSPDPGAPQASATTAPAPNTAEEESSPPFLCLLRIKETLIPGELQQLLHVPEARTSPHNGEPLR